jgi:hypothetical protein
VVRPERVGVNPLTANEQDILLERHTGHYVLDKIGAVQADFG